MKQEDKAMTAFGWRSVAVSMGICGRAGAYSALKAPTFSKGTVTANARRILSKLEMSA